MPCVGPASPPGSEHSGPSWASQGSDWPPLRGHIIHLVLRRKSPCEVAESVIGRPQNTISWTGSEAVCRDAACVGFLRNSTVILWTFTSERSTERGSLVYPTIFVSAMETRECPNTQVQAEHLTAATGHPFEDVTASYYPLGIPGKVAGKSSNTQWAFPTAPDEIWRGPSPARPQQCVHNGWRCRHTLASSVLQRSHYRVPAFASLGVGLKFRRDRRGPPQVLQVYFASSVVQS